MIKRYSELITIDNFLDRFRYLKIDGHVGIETFGFNRYLNQALYTSSKWKKFRNEIILRDNGCDLGIEDRNIYNHIIIHHINPLTEKDIIERSDALFDPDNVICTTDNTHKAIHYGDESLLFVGIVERRPNDTCLWR